MVQREQMPAFEVRTSGYTYLSVVERGVIESVAGHIPAAAGRAFVVTTEDVWALHGAKLAKALQQRSGSFAEPEILFLPGGEANKRLEQVEHLADQMLERGADRTSIVIGFGGGIVTDMGGFLAAIFMRGIPVLQVPTTLLAQVDAAVGGKTGVNLANGKNLLGSFHQPLAVLIDPELTATLPEREFRAGLFEIVKCGVIRDRGMFDLLATRPREVLSMNAALVDSLIAGAVRVKAEVVSADERESGLRRILNYGHTIGHAIESETGYVRFLHGEAVARGMLAATHLAVLRGMLPTKEAAAILETIQAYGPLPSAIDLDPEHLLGRLAGDKKTLQGKLHFVLPTHIGEVSVVSGIEPDLIRRAIVASLQEVR
ncbi:MAG: 3-dehydroquinate synthase [Bryobacteraceae bacterium]